MYNTHVYMNAESPMTSIYQSLSGPSATTITAAAQHRASRAWHMHRFCAPRRQVALAATLAIELSNPSGVEASVDADSGHHKS